MIIKIQSGAKQASSKWRCENIQTLMIATIAKMQWNFNEAYLGINLPWLAVTFLVLKWVGNSFILTGT